MMGRPELGVKCTCTACHERFYDLNRSPAICPKCGVQQPPEKPRTLRPSRGTSGAGSQQRQPTVAVTIDDDAAPVGAEEIDEEDDASEADHEDDDNIEIDPDIAEEAD
jgi:uncharacterized protein (TIGR02300 family)